MESESVSCLSLSCCANADSPRGQRAHARSSRAGRNSQTVRPLRIPLFIGPSLANGERSPQTLTGVRRGARPGGAGPQSAQRAQRENTICRRRRERLHGHLGPSVAGDTRMTATPFPGIGRVTLSTEPSGRTVPPSVAPTQSRRCLPSTRGHPQLAVTKKMLTDLAERCKRIVRHFVNPARTGVRAGGEQPVGVTCWGGWRDWGGMAYTPCFRRVALDTGSRIC